MILVISIILTNALIGKSNLVPAFREPPGGARRQGAQREPSSREFFGVGSLIAHQAAAIGFFLCRKTSGTADSVRLIKRWDGLFSSNCKEEHPE